DLADPDTGPPQGADRFGRLLEFHREMAGVVVHPDVSQQPFPCFPAEPVDQFFEKSDRLPARFEESEGLGFQAEVQVAPGPVAQAIQVFAAGPQLTVNRLDLTGSRPDEFLERTRQGADT